SRNWIWNFAGRESSSARVRQECRTSGWQTSFVMQSCSKLPDVKLRQCWTGRIPRFLQKRLAALSCRSAPPASIPTGSCKLAEVLTKTRRAPSAQSWTELEDQFRKIADRASAMFSAAHPERIRRQPRAQAGLP